MKIRCSMCKKEYDEETITKNRIGWIIYCFCKECQEKLEDYVDKECYQDYGDVGNAIDKKIKDFLRK